MPGIAGINPVWTPSMLSTGVDYWLAEDLASYGEGNPVTGNWIGKQLGSVLSPLGSDQGLYRGQAFLGDGANQSAGLEQTNKAGRCLDSAIINVFGGAIKSYTVWFLGELNANANSVYWGAGNLTSLTQHVYCRYLPTGTIKNQLVLRDGILNVNDSMSEYQVFCPQLIEFQKGSAGAWNFIKDGISEGTTTRVDAGIAVQQFTVGATPNGTSTAAASQHTISAIGIATGVLTSNDKRQLRDYAWRRLGMGWKKGLNP